MRRAYLLAAVALTVFLGLPGTVFAQDDTSTKTIPATFEFSVLGPNVKLSDIVVTSEGSKTTINVPWIADMIAQLYRFAVGAAAVIAAVMLMVGGLQYLTSRGDSSAIDAAKERIQNAVVGLALVLGSYLILWLVNPALVRLDALKVVLIERQTFALPDSALLDDPSSEGRRSTIPIDVSAFVMINEPCMNLTTGVHPVNQDMLRKAAQTFCEKRPEGSTWKITGGGARPASLGLKFYIQRCLYRTDCTVSTSSMTMRQNPEALSVVNGKVVPTQTDLQGFTPQQVASDTSDEYKKVYDFLLPFAEKGFAQSPHGSGLAVDIYCIGVPDLPYDKDVEGGGVQAPYAPCQVFLENIMKEAGFCRHAKEGWHFESKANKMSPSVCLDEFTPGVVEPGHDYKTCDGQYLYGAKQCAPLKN